MQLAGFLHFDKMLGKLPLILGGREGMGCHSGGGGYSDVEGGNEVHKKRDELSLDITAAVERKSA